MQIVCLDLEGVLVPEIWIAVADRTGIADLRLTTRDVANYHLVKPPVDVLAAYSVPWLECIAGVCLMLGILRRGAILTIAGLVVVFSISIGWAWYHKLEISCGCHGGDTPIQYWNKVAEFTGYFILLGWLWWMETRKNPISSPAV